jgi:hypothetical protein
VQGHHLNICLVNPRKTRIQEYPLKHGPTLQRQMRTQREKRARVMSLIGVHLLITNPTQGRKAVSTPPDTSPGGPQSRRSTRSTAGKLETARYTGVFLSRVEYFADESFFRNWHTWLNYKQIGKKELSISHTQGCMQQTPKI